MGGKALAGSQDLAALSSAAMLRPTSAPAWCSKDRAMNKAPSTSKEKRAGTEDLAQEPHPPAEPRRRSRGARGSQAPSTTRVTREASWPLLLSTTARYARRTGSRQGAVQLHRTVTCLTDMWSTTAGEVTLLPWWVMLLPPAEVWVELVTPYSRS